jgi:hypothetical protein
MYPVRGHFQFRVDGILPPKKDGAASMWAKPAEIPRLIALRRAALQSMQGYSPLQKNISLKLSICCPAESLASIGDLDNFITGVCDGLMAAAPRIKRDPQWLSGELASINPEVTIAIVDDSEVRSIQAVKEASTDGSTWYEVFLEGEI